jgi:hypothetical protein
MGGDDTTHEQSIAEETSGVCTLLWQSPHNVDLSCLREFAKEEHEGSTPQLAKLRVVLVFGLAYGYM